MIVRAWRDLDPDAKRCRSTWGRAYIYRMPGERSDYDLISYGKDGQPGGSGDAADISNQLAGDEIRAEGDRAKR